MTSSLTWVLAKVFGFYTKSTGNKSQNRQVGLYQTKNLTHSQGNNQQNEKAIYRGRENTCKSLSDKGLISKIYEELIQYQKYR